jgi:hypothetical protein
MVRVGDENGVHHQDNSTRGGYLVAHESYLPHVSTQERMKI